MTRPAPAPLDGPLRAALERMFPEDPFSQHSAYYLFNYRRDVLAAGVLKLLDAAVEKSLAEAVAS